MKVIFLDVEPDDMVLGVRAAKWLMARFQKDAILSYNGTDFYVRRNKASITVRLCDRAPQPASVRGDGK